MLRGAPPFLLAWALLASCSGGEPAPGDGSVEGDADHAAEVDVEAGPDADADVEAGPDADGAFDGDVETEDAPDGETGGDASDVRDTLDPDRRLQDLEHLADLELLRALHDRVAGHTSLGYEAARLVLFTELDVHGGLVECVYTGLTAVADGTISPGTFNTEHSWPQSEGADAEPARSDLHHLFPTDADANNRRGSHPFGETACVGAACDWAVGGSELGTVTGGVELAFEVRAATRGDIARAHFYFAARYELAIPDTEETFLRLWHAEDPPSVAEQARNDAIEARQANRNPFVDRPDFVARIADF